MNLYNSGQVHDNMLKMTSRKIKIRIYYYYNMLKLSFSAINVNFHCATGPVKI